LSSSFSV